MPAVRRTIHLAYTMGHTAGAGADAARRRPRRPRPPPGPLAPRPAPATTARPPGCWPSSCSARPGPPAASTSDGAQVLLADADRDAWDRALIAEGRLATRSARRSTAGRRRTAGAAGRDRRRARRARRRSPATDWAPHRRAATTRCCTIEPSPTIAVGRCVAMSLRRRRRPPAWPTSTRCIAVGRAGALPVRHTPPGAAARPSGPRRRRGARRGRRPRRCARTTAERRYFADRAGAASASDHVGERRPGRARSGRRRPGRCRAGSARRRLRPRRGTG